jgi:flagellar basal-body rod modification protein FlgD
MNFKLLLTTLLLFSLSPLVAQACPPLNNPKSLAYARRDNNRCEGLQDRDASSTFELISFATGSISSNASFPNTLTIRVPSTGNLSPTIEVQSFIRNYRLDNLEAPSKSSGISFPLDTSVLKKANIPLESLRATAYITRDSGFVYFPVILEQPSDHYQFVVYSPQRTTFPTIEIRRNGKTILPLPSLKTPRSGQIFLTWNRKAPAGTYELYLVDGEGQPRTFRFEHNPSWL